MRHRRGGNPGQLAEPGVGKAHGLETAQGAGGRRQAPGADFRLGFDEAADLAQEPGVDLAGTMDVLVGETQPHGLRHFEQALGRGRAERGAHRVLVVALAEPLDRDLVEPGEAVFE